MLVPGRHPRAPAPTGTGTVWTPVFTTAGKLVLRSSKGDGLHRPDSAPAVTSWGTGIGNEWTLECAADGKFLFKSWKGDYLNRTDAAQGVNAAATGTGTVWSLEMLPNQ